MEGDLGHVRGHVGGDLGHVGTHLWDPRDVVRAVQTQSRTGLEVDHVEGGLCHGPGHVSHEEAEVLGPWRPVHLSSHVIDHVGLSLAPPSLSLPSPVLALALAHSSPAPSAYDYRAHATTAIWATHAEGMATALS